MAFPHKQSLAAGNVPGQSHLSFHQRALELYQRGTRQPELLIKNEVTEGMVDILGPMLIRLRG